MARDWDWDETVAADAERRAEARALDLSLRRPGGAEDYDGYEEPDDWDATADDDE